MKFDKERTVCETIDKMNELGKRKKPFLFIVDYDLQHPIVKPLPLEESDILFYIKGFKRIGAAVKLPRKPLLQAHIPDKKEYEKAFNKVKDHLYKGDSFLVNLTLPTLIDTNFSLLQLFHLAKAKYKLYYKGQFVVFSPETFVKIEKGKIYSYPMKGTINASIPNAQSLLLNNEKEMAEHLTMVDLIRNDLSQFAKNVEVTKLCYLDFIKTNKEAFWQMSSEISGALPENYHQIIGDILFSLLPAGSITGAPKERTLKIIAEAEGYKRGYYTGVFGYFDGEKMDSAVMIRFIEKNQGRLFYKSGGGITAKSKMEAEYRELIQKIYVPIN